MTNTARTSNGFDPEKTQSFVDRIEELDRLKASKHAAYMAECAEINEDKNDVFEEAKSAGLPVKVLKRVVKVRDLERKVEAERDKLDGEDQDNFDLIRHALGDLADTPLGEAATPQKPKRGGGLPGAEAPGTHSTS